VAVAEPVECLLSLACSFLSEHFLSWWVLVERKSQRRTRLEMTGEKVRLLALLLAEAPGGREVRK
jgi:hypothetical protein